MTERTELHCWVRLPYPTQWLRPGEKPPIHWMCSQCCLKYETHNEVAPVGGLCPMGLDPPIDGPDHPT